jgi:hypothetical protein
VLICGVNTPRSTDIWNMRTWGWATLPHWTESDKRRYFDDRLWYSVDLLYWCKSTNTDVLLSGSPGCRRRGVQSIETACDRCIVRCTVTKRRGRPPGIKETKPRKRQSTFGMDDKSQTAGTLYIYRERERERDRYDRETYIDIRTCTHHIHIYGRWRFPQASSHTVVNY